MADHIGKQFGNYRLSHLVGRGGFADVYLGEHIFLKTQAAVKVLRLSLTNEIMETFLTEARMVARLVHPNIVQVLDFGVEGTIPFIVMTYAPNGTIRQRHPLGSLPPIQMAVHYVKQIASALQYAHNEKVVHRDIKPENILIGRSQEILLSDFGVASMLQNTSSHSAEDIIGTVAYMAPEQIRGKIHPASDQYALAIIVYEWLGGFRPFSGSFTELCGQHMFVPPPPLRGKDLYVPVAVEQVVMKALAKEPQDRFVNIQAFATALEQVAQSPSSYAVRETADSGKTFLRVLPPSGALSVPPNEEDIETQRVLHLPQSARPIPVAATQPPPTHQLGPTTPMPPMNPPTAYPLAARNPETPFPSMEKGSYVASASAPLPGSPTIVPAPVAPSPPLVPEQSAQPKRRSRRAALIGLGVIGGLVVAGGGVVEWILSHNSNPLSAGRQGPAQGTTFNTYQGHTDWIAAVAWSPDGKLIASGSNDHTVRVWNALDSGNNSNVLVYQHHSGVAAGLAWSPDGKLIASGGGDNTVQIWDSSTGTQILVYRRHKNGVRCVAWSPDGKLIASGSADNTVQVWNAGTGALVYTFTNHSKEVRGVSWSPDSKRIASASFDTKVWIWDAANGGNASIYSGHTQEVRAIGWSPITGRYIASGSYDGTVQVWDAATQDLILTYNASAGDVNALAWSSDEQYLAAGYGAPVVQVWEALTGNKVFKYNKHEQQNGVYIYTVAWSPKRPLIASAGSDNTVLVWQAV